MKTIRRGLTMMDVLATIVIVVLVALFVVPLFYHRCIDRDLAQLGACKGNLKGIHGSIMMYQEAEERLPVMCRQPSSDADVNPAPTRANATDAPYDESGWEELGDQAMQNMWLLIANENVGQTGFKCPGDEDWQSRVPEAKYGWTNSDQYSYSIQWPYTQDADGKPNPSPFAAPPHGDTIIVADRSPGGAVTDSRPHTNHSATVAFVYWSGAVDTHEATDSRAGIDGNNIYTNAHGEAGGMPANEHDTSLSFSPR
jgi:hypothetical protein